jgi:hypothetical protein
MAEAERGAVPANEGTEDRIEQHGRQTEVRVDQEGKQRAANAEKELETKARWPRAARKLAGVRHALEEESAAAQLLREKCERLESQRSELEGRLAQLVGRTHELEATLERERADMTRRVAELEKLEKASAEHVREHKYRRELEDRLAAERLSGEQVRRELESEAAATATERQRVERLKDEVRAARQEAATERAARQRIAQGLKTLLQARAEAGRAGDQRPHEDDRVLVEAMVKPESAERSPNEVDGELMPPTTERRRRSRFWRRRRRADLPCAVCQRPRPDLSDTDLTASGWALNRAGGLCADCQEAGWRFPAGAAVPFRRIDTRPAN